MSLLPQPVVTSNAFVLRTWPTGETSVIASLLTAGYGYVRVIAKSARRPASLLRPLVQPGLLTSLEFTLAPHRQLQFLRAGSLILDPLVRAASLEKSAFLLASVELVERCRPSGEREGRLFALCEDFVRVLSCAPPGGEAALFYEFEMALLALQGVAPALDSCSCCGTAVELIGNSGQRFSPASGGVVCGRCGATAVTAEARLLTSAVLVTLRELAALARGRLAAVPLQRQVAREVGVLLHKFMGFHLPGYRLPAALDLLRSQSTQRPGASEEGAGGKESRG